MEPKPKPPRDCLTTPQVLAAASIGRRTLFRWVSLGLLPRPLRHATSRRGGRVACWPRSIIRDARAIRRAIDGGATLAELAIAARLRAAVQTEIAGLEGDGEP